MNRKLYVGNLAFSTDDQALSAMFAEAGPVDSVRIISDQATGRSRGFAFVEMATDEGAKAAIERFNEKEVDGRQLTVNEARPKTNDGPRSYGGGGGGGRRSEPRW